MAVKLTPRDVEAIEKALNRGRVSEAVVKVENGKAVIIQVERKKISV